MMRRLAADLNQMSAIPVPVEVLEYLRRNEKIQAIKVLRELRGLSLVDAKNQVEAWLTMPEALIEAPVAIEPVPAPELDPSETLPLEVLVLLANGEKIQAVKALRETTGLGLAAALAQIDARLASPVPLPGSPAATHVAASAYVAGSLSATVQDCLRRGLKIEAIKQLRNETGLGLKEAKDLVEAWQDTPPPPPQPTLPQLIPGTVLAALRKGEKLRAVQAWTVQLGGSLQQAQQAIDQVLLKDPHLQQQYLRAIGLDTVVRVSFQDALMFASGNVSPAANRCVVWCRVPANWLKQGGLDEAALEEVFELIYGQEWRRGSSDGSRYLVSDVRFEIPPDDGSSPWLAPLGALRERHWYAHAMADGGLAKRSREQF